MFPRFESSGHVVMAAPHIAQNLVPDAEYFPQLTHSDEVGVAWFTTTCVADSLVSAQTRATTQPTIVQPSKKFNQKIAVAFPLLRPTIAGMKYRNREIRQRMRTKMGI
jgi:hypothetical protein